MAGGSLFFAVELFGDVPVSGAAWLFGSEAIPAGFEPGAFALAGGVTAGFPLGNAEAG